MLIKRERELHVDTVQDLTFKCFFLNNIYERIKEVVECPVIFVLTEEDTREAVAHGVAGIVVSNHGGRQLDGVLATVSDPP